MKLSCPKCGKISIHFPGKEIQEYLDKKIVINSDNPAFKFEYRDHTLKIRWYHSKNIKIEDEIWCAIDGHPMTRYRTTNLKTVDDLRIWLDKQIDEMSKV